MIKFLDLQRITQKYSDEIHEAVTRTVNSGYYLQEAENKRFETDYAAYIGSHYCVGCGNGLDALIWIYRAYIEMGVMQPGDEVIVPADWFLSWPNPVMTHWNWTTADWKHSSHQRHAPSCWFTSMDDVHTRRRLADYARNTT